MKYRIEQDTDRTKENDDMGLFLVAKHRQFSVAAPFEKSIPQYANEVVDKYSKTHWVFPLEAYIHSGIVLALSGEGNFPDRQWDVSQIGFVFAAKKEWRMNKTAKKAVEAFIEEWNLYLSGEVYGYIIEDDDGNTVDSCWGFYGREVAEEEAKSAMEGLVECQERC
jgi:hypothetical protein